MKELKDQDVWMVGLDVGHNIPPLDKTDLHMALGLVMGSEGEGLRRLVRDTCDLLLTLPMRGQVGSLNVATAGASRALFRLERPRLERLGSRLSVLFGAINKCIVNLSPDMLDKSRRVNQKNVVYQCIWLGKSLIMFDFDASHYVYRLYRI